MNNTAFPIILYLTITGDQSRESGCSFLAENDTHIYSENFYKRYDRQLKGTQGKRRREERIFLEIMKFI